MNNEISKIIREAQKALQQMKSGKIYSSKYVIDRFASSSNENPHDILINNMSDVVNKKFSSMEFISQSDVTELYDKMIGLGGGNSAFRNELGDLLVDNRQFAEVKRTESSLRADREGGLTIEPINKDLSDAFSVALGFGNSNAFSVTSHKDNNLVNKMVISSLAAEGMTPTSIDLVSENDHFVLVAALYKDGPDSVAVHIPIQVSGGIVNPPTQLIHDGEAIPLSKDNIWLSIKESKDKKRYVRQQKFASQRDQGSEFILENQIIPDGFKDFANFETALVSASTMHSSKSVNDAMILVSDELKSYGAFNPNVKIANASDSEIIFDVSIPTKRGHAIVNVPVEIHNGHPNLPSRFYSSTSGGSKLYDFSRAGYSAFLKDTLPDNKSAKVSRDTGSLSTASYRELNDIMIKGATSGDFKIAEDALDAIQSRFDSVKFKTAFDLFTKCLKNSSGSEDSVREQHIQAAVKRGDLIKMASYSELFCPKLGMTLSKITFDDEGRPIPLRAIMSDNANKDNIFISSYDIKFS
jgi:hypothetical protein